MDKSGAKCPENQNSTDCLLRALLNVLAEQKQAPHEGIDWDPITFGFTLLIGLVASMIALATVFQAVLAGGKGGRRANSRAIGRWSKYTTRKWRFSEMSWSYTAYTPVLRLSSLERQCHNATEEKQPREESKRLGLMRQSTLPSRGEAASSKGRISGAAPYPATWLGLFQSTGLENFDDFDLTPTIADYLPDDFIAVPASAEVGAIVTITAAAGVHRLDIDTDPYPVILGHSFQFDFRQHPVLGIIGAFSEYRRIKDTPLVLLPSPDKLAEAAMHSRGIIASWNGGYACPNLRTREAGRDWTLRNVLKSFPPIHRGRDCFIPGYDILDQNQMYIASFILANTPKFPPSIFPSPVWRGYNPFTAIALSGEFWSKVRLRGSEEPNWGQWPDGDLFTDNSSGDPFIWLRVFHHRPYEKSRSQAGIDAEEIRVPLHDTEYKVIILCLNLLDDPRELQAKMSKFPFEEREKLRQAVHTQLARIDIWLTSNGNDDELLTLRKQNLLYTSIILSQAESMTRGGLFNLSGATKLNPKQTEQQQPRATVQHVHFKMLAFLGGLIGDFDLSQRSFEAALRIVPRNWKWDFDNLRDLRDHLRHEVFAGSRTQMGLQETLEDRKHEDDFGKKLQESQSQMRSLIGPKCDLRRNLFNTHQILNRLAAVVGRHSDAENRDEQNRNLDAIDDVLILRTLLIGVLFFTALDNSKVLESGVWDRVVPII
ncbi:hypothetical protein CFIO01_10782 [Colletotrichum fioriniae PJ7]|uniref:Uncharacterized protein n=1 Tax=Colletotrichum fioriniae PJ7 TaxID=1445577 RepID=A0A010RWR1_9PEZI|nr:hypothetical protein CFIO01_10782 [Colletotrichum fioriniae PJ7]